MKAIRLNRVEKVNGFFMFHDGNEWLKFTNRRQYISAITKHEKLLNGIILDLLREDIELTVDFSTPIENLHRKIEIATTLRMVYEFSSKYGNQYIYRISHLLLGQQKKPLRKVA